MPVVNIDDILVSGKTEAEHVSNLTAALDKLTELGLTLNIEKCNLFQTSLAYVGFILSGHGIKPNPEKIKAVVNALGPRAVIELQSFLGAVNYYNKFIEQKSSIAYTLLRNGWHWGETENSALTLLKLRKLTEAPLLCLCNK